MHGLINVKNTAFATRDLKQVTQNERRSECWGELSQIAIEIVSRCHGSLRSRQGSLRCSGKDAQKAWMDRFQDFQERLKGGEEIDFMYRQAIASQKWAVSAIGKQRGWMAKGFTAPPAGEVRQRDLRDIVKTMKDNLAIKAAQKRIAERNAQERRAALARL